MMKLVSSLATVLLFAGAAVNGAPLTTRVTSARSAAVVNPFTAFKMVRATGDDQGAGSQLACYGNYCGLEAQCADGRTLDPATRDPPIDKLDSACFLHDICYTCSSGSTGEACCPDPSLLGVSRAQCDRVLLARLKNDDLCSGSPLDQSVTESIIATLTGRDSTPAELAGCKAAVEGASLIIETLLKGRVFADELSGSGQPSGTSRSDATCTTFQCPYSGRTDCFQPCGDDGCGGQCQAANSTSSSCPSGDVCNTYAHACFRQNGNTANDGDFLGDPTNPSSASSIQAPLMAFVGLAAAVIALKL